MIMLLIQTDILATSSSAAVIFNTRPLNSNFTTSIETQDLSVTVTYNKLTIIGINKNTFKWSLKQMLQVTEHWMYTTDTVLQVVFYKKIAKSFLQHFFHDILANKMIACMIYNCTSLIQYNIE